MKMEKVSVGSSVIVAAGRGRYRLQAEAREIGKDVLVTVWGGTAPHIGSVAMAVPRPSLDNPKNTSATASVFNFIGHKDDRIAVGFAEGVASKLGRNAVVTAGIHLDKMNRSDLEKLLQNAEILLTRLLKEME